MKIYQVGGAVRDFLRGVTPHDFDYVVVGGTTYAMEKMGFCKVGKRFPVFLHPETKDEYALARKEIKVGDKHTDFKFIFDKNVTLEEDIQRRDFTCNALARDIDNGEIVDYVGGKKDIENKILRHVNAEHFVEDPLRAIRLCRFAAQLDFMPAQDTLELCRKMVADGMLAHLSPERIWSELYKAMLNPKFYRFIEVAREIGALAVILPEVEKLWSSPEMLQIHPEGNTGDHVLTALKANPNVSPKIKFAILLHDIGKIATPVEFLPKHHGHEQRSKSLIKKICQRLRVPNEFTNFAILAASQHMHYYHILNMKPGKIYDLAHSMTLNQHCYVNAFIEVCRADFLSIDRPDMEAKMLKFEKKARILRKYCYGIKMIKATELPKFEKLPKDKNFYIYLRQYRIEQIIKKLTECEIQSNEDLEIENPENI